MKSTIPELTHLQQRMGKIERQNSRLKHGVYALACCLVVLLVMGAKVGMKDGHFRQLTVSAISIIDSSGKELMYLGHQEDLGTGIRIYNTDGKRVVGIGLTADENGSGMLVADKDGTPRFGLGMDKGVPSIAMTDDNGKKIIGLGGDEAGYGLVIMDANEVERAAIGFKEGSSGVVMYNATGEYVRGMVQRADGSHFSSYIDARGQEVISK